LTTGLQARAWRRLGRTHVLSGSPAAHDQHYLLLRRNLLYTALTRDKKLVVVVGSRKALRIAVANTKTRQRFTLVRERLCQGFPA
jgi:hypothetical protein